MAVEKCWCGAPLVETIVRSRPECAEFEPWHWMFDEEIAALPPEAQALPPIIDRFCDEHYYAVMALSPAQRHLLFNNLRHIFSHGDAVRREECCKELARQELARLGKPVEPTPAELEEGLLLRVTLLRGQTVVSENLLDPFQFDQDVYRLQKPPTDVRLNRDLLGYAISFCTRPAAPEGQKPTQSADVALLLAVGEAQMDCFAAKPKHDFAKSDEVCKHCGLKKKYFVANRFIPCINNLGQWIGGDSGDAEVLRHYADIQMRGLEKGVPYSPTDPVLKPAELRSTLEQLEVVLDRYFLAGWKKVADLTLQERKALLGQVERVLFPAGSGFTTEPAPKPLNQRVGEAFVMGGIKPYDKHQLDMDSRRCVRCGLLAKHIWEYKVAVCMGSLADARQHQFNVELKRSKALPGVTADGCCAHCGLAKKHYRLNKYIPCVEGAGRFFGERDLDSCILWDKLTEFNYRIASATEADALPVEPVSPEVSTSAPEVVAATPPTEPSATRKPAPLKPVAPAKPKPYWLPE